MSVQIDLKSSHFRAQNVKGFQNFLEEMRNNTLKNPNMKQLDVGRIGRNRVPNITQLFLQQKIPDNLSIIDVRSRISNFEQRTKLLLQEFENRDADEDSSDFRIQRQFQCSCSEEAKPQNLIEFNLNEKQNLSSVLSSFFRESGQRRQRNEEEGSVVLGHFSMQSFARTIKNNNSQQIHLQRIGDINDASITTSLVDVRNEQGRTNQMSTSLFLKLKLRNTKQNNKKKQEKEDKKENFENDEEDVANSLSFPATAPASFQQNEIVNASESLLSTKLRPHDQSNETELFSPVVKNVEQWTTAVCDRKLQEGISRMHQEKLWLEEAKEKDDQVQDMLLMIACLEMVK